MNICLICKLPTATLAQADSMLNAGHTQSAVARFVGLDRQVVGRHVRNGHVKRGNPAAGSAWEKPEPIELDDETSEVVALAAEDLAYAIHGVDPGIVAEHRAHQQANVDAQDWRANIDDACPAAHVLDNPAIDTLVDAALAYRAATVVYPRGAATP